MKDTTEIIVKIIFSIVLILISTYLIPYLKTLRDDVRWQKLINMVEAAVNAAEQTIKEPGSGKEKKEMVVKFVTKWMVEQGISVTEDEVDALIEAAVKRMNDKSQYIIAEEV